MSLRIFFFLHHFKNFNSSHVFYRIDINVYDEYGYSELHNAVARGSIDDVSTLLRQGASTEDLTLLTDLTPLHVAALEGQLDIMKLLIQEGAQVNVKCRLGRTPLMVLMASTRVQESVASVGIHLLINAGADFNLVCNKGRTALRYGRRTKIRRALVHYMAMLQHCSPGKKIISDLNLSIIESRPKLRERLAKCFAELDIIERTEISGHILLHNLVMKNPKELAPFTYNPEIGEFFENQDLEIQFPLFGKSMRRNWELAKEEASRRWS